MAGKHVAVLMGGWSAEREISLLSGDACADTLQQAGYRVSKIDVDCNVARTLTKVAPDVVLNALHGPFGEDGTIQGILEFLKIPYTHSGVLPSALAMNKEKAKIIASAAGISVAKSKVMHRLEVAKNHPIKPPYVIKPVTQGSSFGVFILYEDSCTPPQELCSVDWPYGDFVMVEQYVPGRELTCAVMGDKVLGVTEIFTKNGNFYNFEEKYHLNALNHVCPAKIKPNIYQKIAKMSLRVTKAIGCKGINRSDFRFDDRLIDSEPVWLEINTQPGMTMMSLVPELAAHAGYSFTALLEWMIEDASCCR